MRPAAFTSLVCVADEGFFYFECFGSVVQVIYRLSAHFLIVNASVPRSSALEVYTDALPRNRT